VEKYTEINIFYLPCHQTMGEIFCGVVAANG